MNRFGNRRRGAAPAASRVTPRAESVATVSIDSIAAGGDGVARLNGLTCFVPRTAPGDRVQISYVDHGRYARGRVLQILESGSDRITARCRHYESDQCGGCQLQHLTEAAQQLARRTMVRDAMQRVAKRDVPLPNLMTANAWEYRERLTLSLRTRGGQVTGGLIPFVRPALPFDLQECAIAHPVLVECWRAIRTQLRGVPASNGEQATQLSIRLVDETAQKVAVVVAGVEVWNGADQWAAGIAAATPLISAVWVESARGRRSHLFGDSDAAVLAFAQVNRAVSRALRDYVVRTIRALRPASVIDAYAGRGDLTVALAPDGFSVVAIEADRAATYDASDRVTGFPLVSVQTALVEDALPDVLPADVVVLNPPRRGVDVRVCAALADAADGGVRAIVYVSCDPATLARDLSRLPRWRIASLECFDMFPQTAHVETVCVLVPEHRDEHVASEVA